jgi:hypothetical protein
MYIYIGMTDSTVVSKHFNILERCKPTAISPFGGTFAGKYEYIPLNVKFLRPEKGFIGP